MSTPASSVLQSPNPKATYQAVYDSLGRAYWDASDMESKDLVKGVQDAIGEIITEMNEQDLANNTALFVQLQPKIKAVNDALKKVQEQINSITKNLKTAGAVLSTINKAVSLFP